MKLKDHLQSLTTTHNTFEGKKSYEQVKLLLYRHWFILLEKVFAFIFLAILPLILYVFGGEYIARSELTSLFWFVIVLYYLLWWYGLFYAITMYLLDTWVVTDHRILDSEQHGFFSRIVSEVNLAKIQDISVRIRGPVSTFLNFGDISIQTAGTKERFTFKQVPDPRLIKDTIMAEHNAYLAAHKNGREVHEEL